MTPRPRVPGARRRPSAWVGPVAFVLGPVLSGCGGGAGNAGDIRALPAVASAALGGRGALYLTVLNEGPDPDALTAVALPDVGRATFHATTGGRMREVDRLELPPGDTVRLTVGSMHIMLEGAEGLAAGSTTEATLTFASGRTLTVPVRVVAYADLLDALDR